MADAVPSEKLRQYLRELKPQARALLAAELERKMLRGEEPPGTSAILEELRKDARREGRKLVRVGNAQRLFYMPARALPRRRHGGAQASGPYRARLSHADLGLDVARSDAERDEDLFGSGQPAACRQRTKRRRACRARVPGSCRAAHPRGADRNALGRQGAAAPRDAGRYAARDGEPARACRHPEGARRTRHHRFAPAADHQQSCRRAARKRPRAARVRRSAAIATFSSTRC